MDYEFWPAVIAGIAGGAVMSMMMALARKQGITEMDISLVEGAYFSDDPRKARTIGMALHLLVMSGLLIGSVYALLFGALQVSAGNAWWWGALFGVAHGVLGGVGMVMLPAVHPRIGTAGAAPGTAVEPIELRAPGLFAKNYGPMTPVGLMIVHVLYGLTVGAVYAWLAA